MLMTLNSFILNVSSRKLSQMEELWLNHRKKPLCRKR